jgi:hypothetical protein
MQTLQDRAQTQPFAHLRQFNRQCMALAMQSARNFDALENYVFPDGEPLKSYLPDVVI